MEFDLLRLKNNIDKTIEIDEDVSFDNEKFNNPDLLDLKDVHVSGKFSKDSMGDICLYISVKGIMILQCAITLEEVPYDFSVIIDDRLENILKELEIDKKVENTIDILPIIWENILMEIPSRVVSPNAKDMKTSGDGWKMIDDEEVSENPELAKLKDLL